MGLVTVLGEALIDLVPGDRTGTYEARPGGSPYNVAIGLARLGVRTALMARIPDSSFGRHLRQHAAAEGVDLTASPLAAEPTTLAVVSLDADAQATYDLYVDGTSDWQWTEAETALLPPDTAVLHVGSIASWTAPGSEVIHELLASVRERVLVSYDPNVRPALLGSPARGRDLIERTVGVAHVVKASREDVAWLYPGDALDAVATRWLGLGASLVLVTDGADGAHAFQLGIPGRHRPGRTVDVIDTVGAGDSFTSALLAGLVGLPLEPEALDALVDRAILASSISCTRAGADPPTAADLLTTLGS